MPNEEPNRDLALFEQKQLRRVWYKGEWYYSIIDVIALLADSTNPRVYWSKLKERATSEGFEETLSQVEPLKLKSPDRRFRLTDTANRQTLLRRVQPIPSPRAEPLCIWRAGIEC